MREHGRGSRWSRAAGLWIALTWGLVACAESEEGPPVDPDPAPTLADELGLSAYLGLVEPAEVSTHNDATVWTFAPEDGPMCMRGRPFQASFRATESEDLVVFLQGGGACWSAFCLAVTAAPPGVPRVNLLDPSLPENPVADWNVLYLPYCDGSLFVGDRDHDDNGDGQPDRFHRGLWNLSAALSAAREEMPAPRRILLAGASAGGFGTVLAVVLVRHVWPDAELMVLSDSGVGVAKDGDPDFVLGLLDEFNALRFIPADCEGCLDRGHIVSLVAWGLARMPDVRVATFSSWRDKVIAEVFLEMEPELFEAALARETDAVHAAFPERYRRFFVQGTMHTTVLGDPSGIIGSDLRAVELPPGALNRLSGLILGRLAETASADGALRFSAWLRSFVEGDEGWVDHLDPRD